MYNKRQEGATYLAELLNSHLTLRQGNLSVAAAARFVEFTPDIGGLGGGCAAVRLCGCAVAAAGVREVQVKETKKTSGWRVVR